MKKRARQLILLFAAAMVVASSLSGCGERVSEQSEVQTEQVTVPETETERPTEPVTTMIETETESETQKLIRSVDYTSKDGSIKITLPDNTWKVTQDADEMRVFQSGSAAMINIVHANTETAMKSLTVMTSREELQDSLTKQYSDANAFEIESFVTAAVNDVNVYRYVVKYFDKKRMWAYSVTNAVVAQTQAYVVKGSVMDDNRTLLEEVQTSVESFKVLSDEQLKTATGEIISGIVTTSPDLSSSTVQTDTSSADELAAITNYPTSKVLMSNDDVNVRMQPGTDCDYLSVLAKGQNVTVVGETPNWYKVSIDGNTGYIRKDFLVASTSPEEIPVQETQTEEIDHVSAAELNNTTDYSESMTLTANSDANVRLSPSTDSDVIDGLVTGDQVQVLGETDNWFVVLINGAKGYVAKDLLTSGTSASDNSIIDVTNDGVVEESGQNTEASAGADTADGADASNDAGTSNSEGSNAQSSDAVSTGKTYISGTVVGTAVDSLVLAGDDGNTYSVYYGDANMDAPSGIYDGLYVGISLDSTQASGDGTLYATNVSGE